MNLESAIKYFSPKSLNLSDAPAATGERMAITDVMAALGLAEAQAQFGMAAFLAKTGVSTGDRDKAIGALISHARRTAPKLVVKAAGSNLGKCLVILSRLAFEEYCRSAATTSWCRQCNGNGSVDVHREVVTYAGHISSMTGEVAIPQITRTERVKELCSHCNGKGTVSARCRCNGTGRIRDMAESELQGVPVYKTCERCSGRGFRRMPATRAFRAVKLLVPDLHERTWNRNWKPFFEALVAKCEIEESHADAEFRRVTR